MPLSVLPLPRPPPLSAGCTSSPPLNPLAHPPPRFTGSDQRRGTARLLLGLGISPGSKQCAGLLGRINGTEGFSATDISDMDLAQVGGHEWQETSGHITV